MQFNFGSVVVAILSLLITAWIVEKLWSLARAGWKGLVVALIFWLLLNVGYSRFLDAFLDRSKETGDTITTHPATAPIVHGLDSAVEVGAKLLNVTPAVVVVQPQSQVQVTPQAAQVTAAAGAAPTAVPGYETVVSWALKTGTDLDMVAWGVYVRQAITTQPHQSSLPQGWSGTLRGVYGVGGFYKNRFTVEVKSPSGIFWTVSLPDSVSADAMLTSLGTREKNERGLLWRFDGLTEWPPSKETCGACYNRQETQVVLPTQTPTSTPQPGVATNPTPTPVPATAATCTQVTSAGLNIRSGPGTDNRVVGTAAQGDVFQVFEIAAANGWQRIGEGRWISGNTLYVTSVACP